MAYRMTGRRRAALRKAQLASARKRKSTYVAKNRKKIQRTRGVREYKRTGLVSPTPSRTWGQTNRKLRKGSRMNVKHGKKIAKLDRKIVKARARVG